MFALCYKEPYIVPEPLTKNRTHQTWRGKQLAICADRKPLDDYISRQQNIDNYYVEELGH